MRHSFILRAKANKTTGKHAVMLRLTQTVATRKTVRKYILTPIEVLPLWWNPDTQRVYNHVPDAADMNLQLEHLLARLNDMLVRYRLSDTEPNIEVVAERLTKNRQKNLFSEFIADEIQRDQQTGARNPETIKSYSSALVRLNEFKAEVPFSSLNHRFMEDFNLYLKNLGNSINTRWKHTKVLKSMARRAMKEGIPVDRSFFEYQAKKVRSNRVFLSRGELGRLIAFYELQEMGKPYQDCLELFLFSCFTGLRISDVQQVNSDMVHDGILTLTMQKNRENLGKVIAVPLGDMAKRFFPSSSNWARKRNHTTINQKLQELMRPARISKHVTFHVARHTFATQFLASGGQVTVLKELLGHSKIEDTMIYVHISSGQKIEGIKHLDQEFSKIIRASEAPNL